MTHRDTPAHNDHNQRLQFDTTMACPHSLYQRAASAPHALRDASRAAEASRADLQNRPTPCPKLNDTPSECVLGISITHRQRSGRIDSTRHRLRVRDQSTLRTVSLKTAPYATTQYQPAARCAPTSALVVIRKSLPGCRRSRRSSSVPSPPDNPPLYLILTSNCAACRSLCAHCRRRTHTPGVACVCVCVCVLCGASRAASHTS